jgi:hypothetical protein
MNVSPKKILGGGYMDRIVFVDVCYICGRKVYGRESTFDKTWTSNFKGLTAHIKCLKKRMVK